MKKIIPLSIAFAVSATISAEKLQIFKCSEDGIPGVTDPQLIGLGISPDGNYVCGTLEQTAGIFVAESSTGEVKYDISDLTEGGQMRHVDNNGLAIGFASEGITYSFPSGEATAIVALEGIKFVMGEDLSADGAVMVGSFAGDGFATVAVYSSNGSGWKELPFPTDAQFGNYLGTVREESAAKAVSGDGKVIMGNLGGFAVPVIWMLNDNGSYDVDFFPERFVKVIEEDLNDDSKVLFAISGTYVSLSNNGRYAAMVGLYKENIEDLGISVPVVYDTMTKDIKVYNEYQEVDELEQGLYPLAIADDGTFVGSIGDPYQTSGAFIMNAGKTQAEAFRDAFPEFYEILGESDLYGFNVPQGISADGTKIMGCTYYAEDYFDMSTPAYWATYIIDTKDENAVDEITSSQCDEAIYSIDGRVMRSLTKGLNIVRNADGSVRKILNK